MFWVLPHFLVLQALQASSCASCPNPGISHLCTGISAFLPEVLPFSYLVVKVCWWWILSAFGQPVLLTLVSQCFDLQERVTSMLKTKEARQSSPELSRQPLPAPIAVSTWQLGHKSQLSWAYPTLRSVCLDLYLSAYKHSRQLSGAIRGLPMFASPPQGSLTGTTYYSKLNLSERYSGNCSYFVWLSCCLRKRDDLVPYYSIC